MNDLELQDIFIYPIKSLGGITLQQAEVQPTGLQYDRRWMLVDKSGVFMSQRTFNQMALLQVALNTDGIKVSHKYEQLTPLIIPFNSTTKRAVTVSIWDDVCLAVEVDPIASEWLSDALNKQVELVYMPATTHRPVDQNYAYNDEIVSFADAYPFLLIGQSSLDDLNGRLATPVLMNRFRPNFVFKGGYPYCEDSIHSFRINQITFTAAKPCARCVMTTVDQENATKGTEPLKTLSAYRTVENKVLFGQNLVHNGTGIVKVGDKITLT